MSHISPEVYIVWSIVSCLLGGFLLFHLWSFDRFKCLKWNSGPYSGAFKRIMTYSYLLSIPLIAVYSLGNAVIKYREGFIQLPPFGTIPKPWQLWGKTEQKFIFPLNLCFSMAWGLEMVTHLEELCFWLYLVNSTSSHQDWFKSWYFKAWVVGSAVSVVYMPFVTIFTRWDPLKSETYTFLAGSIGSLSLTLWFLPILYMFPSFLQNLRSEGVDMGTIVRLTKFEELNRIRVLFRFFFCVPLLILALDGLRPHHHLNESILWTDVLPMLSAFGVAVSSGITLVIFFPRSIEGEIAAKDAEKERKRSRTGRSIGRSTSFLDSRGPSRVNTNMSGVHSFSYAPQSAVGHSAYLTSSPVKADIQYSGYDALASELDSQPGHEFASPRTSDKLWEDEERDVPAALPPILRPNRRRGGDVEFGGFGSLTESNLSIHNMKMSNVNPLVHNFTSPIDLGYATTLKNEPKYTFRK